MIDQALHEKIEAYLLGKMPPQEARAFKSDIQNDAELAEEVELHRLILPVPDRLAELDLRQDFAQWRQEMESSPPMPKRDTAKWWIAAVALLLLAGAFWLWQDAEARFAREQAARQRAEQALEAEKLKSERREQENQQLRQDMLNLQQPNPTPATDSKTPPGGGNSVVVVPSPPPQEEPEYVALADQELIAYVDNFSETLRIRGTRSEAIGEELVDKADTAINKRQYRTATNLLTRVKPDDPMYSKSLEMLAYVYFKRKQYTQAVNTYLKYRKFDGNTDKTDWELCLFYLGDYPRYRSEFQKLLNSIIADEKHPKRDKAIALRNELAKKGIWPK